MPQSPEDHIDPPVKQAPSGDGRLKKLFKPWPWKRKYHGYVDRFTVMHHCVYAEGWANHCDPAIFYDGRPLKFTLTHVDRPDLAQYFPPEARSWGFALCAALPTAMIDRTKFRLRINRGMIFDNPAETFIRALDADYVAMEERFKEAVRRPNASLLEIGSRARSGVTYRNWFPDLDDYMGIDIVEGANVDLVCDAHHLSDHVQRTFDFVFSMATFEHLMMPWKVAIEMNKVMRDGGMALIVSHAAWPLHEVPWDFWRFSKEAWGGLFNAHTGFRVLEAAYRHETMVVPDYISNVHFEHMSQGRSYLISGCLVEKIGPSTVQWHGDMAQTDSSIYGW